MESLQYLPFAALPVPGGRSEPVPMVVEHEIVGLPSASVLAVLRRETRGRTASAQGGRRPGRSGVRTRRSPAGHDGAADRLGAQSSGTGLHRGRLTVTERSARPGSRGRRHPGLPATGCDAAGSQHHPCDRSCGDDAAGDRLRRKSGHRDESRARPVQDRALRHPRCLQQREPWAVRHRPLDAGRAGHAQDGFLRLHDIYGLQLPAELVVLSACDTALGKQVRGAKGSLG